VWEYATEALTMGPQCVDPSVILDSPVPEVEKMLKKVSRRRGAMDGDHVRVGG
jgi:hypothetical protein